MPGANNGLPGLRPRRKLVSEINVAPFVDVMLVLLVVFMVAAPLMQQQVIDVNLPEAETTDVQLAEEPLLITVKEDGATFLADLEVPPEQLREKLEAVLNARGDENVYVRADRKAPYGAVARVLAAAQNAGVSALGLVTEPE